MSRSLPRAEAAVRRLVLVVVAAALVLAALDTYVVVTLLPRMMTDLGVGLDQPERAAPVLSGFLLGYIVTMPLLGAASDVYGRRSVLLGCLGLFALGSVITAAAGVFTADSPGVGLVTLVGGRVLQGLGGGALVPLAMALAADLYPAGGRAQALGAVAALQETGSVAGPLYGALLAAAAAGIGGWRVVFLVNLPVAAICALLLFRFAAGSSGPPGSAIDGGPAGEAEAGPALPGAGGGARAAAGVDWVGGGLLAAGLALVIVALYPDDPSAHAVGRLFVPCGIAGGLLLGLFARQQARRPDSLVPRRLARDPVFIGASLTNLLLGVALMVALVDIPVFAEGVFGLHGLGPAFLLAQFMVAIPLGAVAGGWLSNHVGYRVTAAGGLLLGMLAYLEMSTWQSQEIGRRVFGVPPATLTLLLLGLGFGLVIAPVAAAILDRSGNRDHGLSSSLVVVARMMGMLVGLSALAAFGIRRFNQLAAQGPSLAGATNAAAIEAAIRSRVNTALTQEYHEIFLLAAAVCALAAVVAAISLGRPRPLVAV
ncbi:MAG: MFS transporter [Candidatus Dormibacteria bacterium]